MIIYSVFGHKCDKLQRVVLRLKSYSKVPLDSRSVIILVFVFFSKIGPATNLNTSLKMNEIYIKNT